VRRVAGLCAISLALMLAAPAADAKRKPDRMPGAGTANPSALVALEMAFARMAQEKGQWTAFRQYADDDAVMFVPQPVRAKDWLKGRANPAQAVKWQPYQVWMSCDGTLGVTRGAWQRPDGSVGYFTTAWRKQKSRSKLGEYLWEMDQGDVLPTPLPQSEFLDASVADCSPPAPPADMPLPAGAERRSGWSKDKTLHWTADVRADGSRTISLQRWTGQAYAEVFRSDVAAGG